MDAEKVFDRMERTGVYIVDKETFITYYENPIAQKTSVKDRIGLPCYSIHGNNSVCASCPIRKPNHTSFVDRADLGMIFIVQSEEIEWNGHPSYLITVKRHETLPQMTDSEKSMRRMNRALQHSVNVYTEINLETMRYRQVNIHDAKNYTASPEGEYAPAYEAMLHEKIDPNDAEIVKKTMSPEIFKKVGADSNGPRELIARYHLKDDPSGRLMQSRAIFMRDELPHYVVAVVTDVTEEMVLSEQKDSLEALLNSIDVGIYTFEFHGDDFKIINANKAIVEMSKRDKSMILGASAKEVFKYTHPDDYPIIQNVIETLKHPNQWITYQYRTRPTKSNEYIWLEARGHSVAGPDGCVRAYISYIDITESKKQEAQLLLNQQSVELAQNEGRLAIWTYNIDRKLLVQQTPTDVDGHLGYPIIIEDVPNSFVKSQSIHPDDVKKYREAYKKLEDGAQKSDVIYRIIDLKSGKYTWVHMFHQRIRNNENSDRIAAGFSMEINKQQEAIERYQTEQKLREQMYRDAALYVEYNLMTNKYEGTTNLSDVYHTQQWENPSEENYRKNMSLNVEEPYLDEFVKTMYSGNLLKAFEKGEVKVSCDYRSKGKTGFPSTWYRATATMVQHPDSDDVIAFIYIQNIEQKKQRQLALESSLTDGVESIAIIQLSDRQARIIRSNSSRNPKAVGETFLYDDDLVDRSHKAVVEENEFADKAARLSTIVKELSTKEIYQYSVSMVSQEENPKRRLFRFRYLDDRKAEIVFSISDITAIYQVEQEKNKALENALDKAQKANEAKAEFYSRMSHDMRTPMNGILGMAELSKDETDLNKLKDNIGKIQESGEYLLSLVNDTLDIQRIESGKLELEPQVVDCRKTIENAIDMVMPSILAKKIDFRFVNKGVIMDCNVRIDAVRVKQIFVNLVSNAIKFTPEGGKIFFEFECMGRDGMMAHDRFRVRDTGVGMSEKFVKENIFKPFAQEQNVLSGESAGSGLGLSIVKKLVELMGGTIEVQSELGKGTEFIICLDVERVDENADQNPLADASKKQHIFEILQNRKILLAEDHPLNAEIATKLLEKAGCTVTWVENGQACLDTMKEFTPGQYDLILMDLRMPVMDGITATKEIRKLDRLPAKQIPIIAMTANAYSDDVESCLAAGMNAHISKPIQSDVMFQTIVTVLEETK